MPLALLVPGLLDVDAAALASCAPLARVAALGEAQAVDDAESELLRVLDIPAAVAPLAALGAGVDVGGDWVARADPVSTVVSHEDVRIVGRVDDLAEDETTALIALLDRHFADDALAFVAPRADALFVRSRAPHEVATPPLAAVVGRPLRERLPSGPDARRWRRWWTEVQMLLHEHPLAAREPSPVNALWFSGAGTLPAPPVRALATFAGVQRSGDVVRGLARLQVRTTAPLAAAGDATQRDADGDVAIVVDPVADARDAARCAEAILAPLLAALERGRIDRFVLVAGGRTGAARWDLRRPTLVRRLFRRAGRFVPPARDHDT
jgi:hypothetical protein